MKDIFCSVLLILLVALLYIWLKRILYNRSFIKTEKERVRIKSEYDRLLSENAELKLENLELQKTLEQTIALHDVTKQICKSLDTDKVFINFKEEINKYIKVGDYKFLKGDIDLAAYTDYTVIQLDIDKKPTGYLIAKGFSEQDRYKFNILAQQFILGVKRAILYQRVQELAITDSLTGVFSRRYYMERFKEEIERSEKFGYSFSCLMIDIDYFKDYNDRYGHLVGDAILKELSKTIKENIRQIDLIGRYGGEEFSVILTETDKEQAKFAAQRIRQAVEYKQIRVYDEDLKITVSLGISVFPQDGKDIETIIDNADSALYSAKQTGRNKVCVSGE